MGRFIEASGAERKAGASLAGMELKPGRGNNNSLLSMGVSLMQSSRWQRAAVVPEKRERTSGGSRRPAEWASCREGGCLR